jgi:hypothetical protein
MDIRLRYAMTKERQRRFSGEIAMLTIRAQQMQAIGEGTVDRRNVLPCQPTWLEIALVDDEGQPLPGAKYRMKLPDASIQEGVLDDRGMARVNGIMPGQCTITFPEIDKNEWRPF